MDKRGAIHSEPEKIRALVILESAILNVARNYLTTAGFFEVIVPHITKATGSCENPNTLFEVLYSDDKLTPYLSQTGQLYLEVAVPILDKVWCFGPSFRKEKGVDDRHLTEFNLLELEFSGDFTQLLSIIEDLIKAMVEGALSYKKELETLGIDYQRLENLKIPFKRVTYDDAIELLNLRWGDDLNSKCEKILLDKFGNNPIFITHFPEEMKFFNMKRNSLNPKVVNSADLLLPFSGEAVGAAEREYSYERVRDKLEHSSMFRNLKEKGRKIDDFWWYFASLEENKNCPHAGCGIGIERVFQFILGNSDIHNSALFPIDGENIF